MDSSLPYTTAGLVVYIVASRVTMRLLRGGARDVVTALLNLAGVLALLFHEYPAKFFACVVIVVFFYGMLRLFSEDQGRLVWPAFLSPIAALIIIRYVPGQFYVALGHALGRNLHSNPGLLGISYLTFRCGRLVWEVRNGSVPKPGFWQYLSFAFFLPTMSLGPINTYASFRRGFEVPAWSVSFGSAALRMLVGMVKYQFLGGAFNQLSYSAFLLDGHPHNWLGLPVSMVFYYLYLYCNFSGFCDLAIGASALIGIPVLENFHNPMAARNMKEFWNRWHITLSQWMRDIVFAPLSKFLVRVTGPARANHAIALAIAIVFLLVGIWHGAGWNFVCFGAFQALGVVVTHYYTIFLKKRLGREGFKTYNENRWIHAAAVVTTFAYFSATTLFFANTLPQIREIFSSLR